MTDKYILDGQEAVIEPDLHKWGIWFQTADRHVASDKIDKIRVSTVFLGLDHSFDEGPPQLFETMVFGGPLADEMDRYATWAEAKSGHAKMFERVLAATTEEG